MFKKVSCLLILLIFSFALRSEAEKRVALVIGNSDYQSSPLRNPANDATDISVVLRSLDFEVTLKTNAGRESMENAIKDFARKLNSADVGLFYFSGHGCQVEGQNYLIPVGKAMKSASDIKYNAVNAGYVLSEMEEASNPTNIIILDACRNNPFRGFRSVNKGFTVVEAPDETFIAYATAPGSVAEDGSGRNGTYTKHLLQEIKTPGIDIDKTFRRVAKAVKKETNGKQVPWRSSSITEDFIFKTGIAPKPQPIKPDPVIPTPVNPQTITIEGIEFVYVPGGTFQMGSQFGDAEVSDEKPVHSVTLDDFYMSKYEITFEQYDRFCNVTSREKPDDEGWGRSNRPVINASWNDAVAFCEWFSTKSGKKVRLPTEAEWEYAARSGGKKEKFAGFSDKNRLYKYSNFCDLNCELDRKTGNQDDGYANTAPTGSFLPNGLGLYDMSGNVWEWCQDWYDESFYSHSSSKNPICADKKSGRCILRGGSWGSNPSLIRVATRINDNPTLRNINLGFRVCFAR